MGRVKQIRTLVINAHLVQFANYSYKKRRGTEVKIVNIHVKVFFVIVGSVNS